ncbi:MAG: GNAT family N-acetyltransferase [Deinococcota bacterium]
MPREASDNLNSDNLLDNFDVASARAGTLDVTITYLEMLTSPAAAPALLAGTQVIIAKTPTISFYRYLYNTVGEPWLWYERRRLSDDALARIVQDPKVHVHVLYVEGVPAGYGELDTRTPGQVELAYFGLMPEFIGRGVGKRFLQYLCETAWQSTWQEDIKVTRLWVHTCTLDHPRALSVYQSVGFVSYKQTEHRIADPRVSSS